MWYWLQNAIYVVRTFFYLHIGYAIAIPQTHMKSRTFPNIPSQRNGFLLWAISNLRLRKEFCFHAPNSEKNCCSPFITYRRESWGPDLDRRRSGGEPPLLAGWPWYQEAVGLSDEDRETESVREHIVSELITKTKHWFETF